MQYLDFTGSRCRDCYKCLRECPVKAIKFVDHEARIITDRCILCGKCTVVCPQNAKRVHSEIGDVEALLASGKPVIASVAPSFVSAFGVKDFAVMGIALGKLGFKMAEETAVGANIVTAEYEKLLETGEYKNFITSACPAINRMIQLYYPKALKYLAPVASPMVAHARLLKKRYPEAEIVFIGPCIAKKREGRESGLISAVLTFTELKTLFDEKGIDLNAIAAIPVNEDIKNRSKYYPISRGIIKSFNRLPQNYEYVAVDGVKRSFDVLEDIDKLEGMFIEINCCEYACINGPATIKNQGSLKANEDVRRYAQDSLKGGEPGYIDPMGVDYAEGHPRISLGNVVPSERDIRAVLAKTGKFKPEDELNCGACGYPTCREKAIAVLNGNADLEMCIPYMRKRAESMSYEIIQNSPNGIIMMDYDLKISESNSLARKLLGINLDDPKGTYLYESINAAEFFQAVSGGKDVHKQKIYIEESKRYVDMNIILLPEHKTLFAVLKDVTDAVEYSKELDEVREKTLETTDAVIKKQMRVAQEIASLLGETTAETKVALLKLKNTLAGEKEE
ncbi:MAG TPA: PAS domain-containing protein [Candidatus Stercoripulliclostridium merdigallinarum]|uniref:PAS domain-containing protein n=1 Tax=Candidatus Stercoripulliclostridium merdigallinarum TaxID=2840951 RepID=A0A9D1MHD2_9FIRM|nr:PAS domain-containing protein [Candidatus Stercoripulliclostridium merdigallinarum]